MNQKQKIRELAKEKLNNKKIVLFGAGPEAQRFFDEYSERLNIVRVVSNVRSEWGEKCFKDVLDVGAFSIEDVQDDEYIVVCARYAFDLIESQLVNLGLEMFSDFIESRIVTTFLENKKLALFRGSCILRDIFNEIKDDKEFGSIYDSIYSMDNYTAHKFDKKIVYYAAQICDLYLYSYRMLQQDKVHIIGKDELPDDCIMISVSNISFGGFWPQTGVEMTDYNDNMLIPYDVYRTDFYYHMTYTDNDRNINKLMEEGKNWEQIYEILSDENYYSEKEVKKAFRIGMKSLELAGKAADIEIGDFIQENYKSLRLFQDTIHINKYIIAEYKKKIYERLGIPYLSYEEYKRKGHEYVHHGGDRPIYPSVYKRLELEWVDDSFEYEIMTYYGVVKMNFKEYIKHYVEYTLATQYARKLWEV